MCGRRKLTWSPSAGIGTVAAFRLATCLVSPYPLLWPPRPPDSRAMAKLAWVRVAKAPVAKTTAAAGACGVGWRLLVPSCCRGGGSGLAGRTGGPTSPSPSTVWATCACACCTRINPCAWWSHGGQPQASTRLSRWWHPHNWRITCNHRLTSVWIIPSKATRPKKRCRHRCSS